MTDAPKMWSNPDPEALGAFPEGTVYSDALFHLECA